MQLKENESLTPELLRHLQRQEATRIALHAFDHTRFYREFYTDAGFTRSDVSQPENFTALPVLEKHHLINSGADLIARTIPVSRLLPSSTGGSTGEPVRLFHDRHAPIASMWRRAYRWWGISPSDHQATVYRLSSNRRADLLKDVKWWPTRTLRLNARALTAESVQMFLADWSRVHPALVNGYVGGVHELALQILARGDAPAPPRAVGVTAAPITASQRATITEAFNSPVYDQYRSAEVPWIAVECTAHDGLHVQADLRLLELLGPTNAAVPQGAEGSVALTDFTNSAYPLVRYRIGDRTRHLAGRCPCGNNLDRIAPVAGRVSDAIRTPGGLTVTGGLTALFNEHPQAVRQFQIVQHSDYSVTLKYVPGTAPDAYIHVEMARQELAYLLEDRVPVRTQLVAVIGHDEGKTRTIVSELTQAHTTTDKGN